VDDLLLFQIFQGLKDLDGEPPDQREGDPHKVVILDELIQVDREEFERDD
jgi:hypothetical protein